MLAACTSDTNGQVGSVFPLEGGYPLVQKVSNGMEHVLYFGMGVEKVYHLFVPSSKTT